MSMSAAVRMRAAGQVEELAECVKAQKASHVLWRHINGVQLLGPGTRVRLSLEVVPKAQGQGEPSLDAFQKCGAGAQARGLDGEGAGSVEAGCAEVWPQVDGHPPRNERGPRVSDIA